MISGVVNAHREATIRLSLQAAEGRDKEIEAILDTGFNGLALLYGHDVHMRVVEGGSVVIQALPQLRGGPA